MCASETCKINVADGTPPPISLESRRGSKRHGHYHHYLRMVVLSGSSKRGARDTNLLLTVPVVVEEGPQHPVHSGLTWLRHNTLLRHTSLLEDNQKDTKRRRHSSRMIQCGDTTDESAAERLETAPSLAQTADSRTFTHRHALFPVHKQTHAQSATTEKKHTRDRSTTGCDCRYAKRCVHTVELPALACSPADRRERSEAARCRLSCYRRERSGEKRAPPLQTLQCHSLRTSLRPRAGNSAPRSYQLAAARRCQACATCRVALGHWLHNTARSVSPLRHNIHGHRNRLPPRGSHTQCNYRCHSKRRPDNRPARMHSTCVFNYAR